MPVISIPFSAKYNVSRPWPQPSSNIFLAACSWKTVSASMASWLGSIPIFAVNQPTGFGILAGGIVLAVMVAPLMVLAGLSAVPVVVLAVDDKGRVLLERQYRHAAAQYLWELPAGRIDDGEKPLAAAKRELEEETGYRAKRWKRVLFFYATPGFVAEPMSVFLAEDLTAGTARPEDDEVIYKRLVPLSKAVDMVMRGTIRDAKTISGVLWFSQRRKR